MFLQNLADSVTKVSKGLEISDYCVISSLSDNGISKIFSIQLNCRQNNVFAKVDASFVLKWAAKVLKIS